MGTAAQWRMMQGLFTVSGAAALAYEIVWGRWLATVLGASTIATCVVLACYMGGLAAGAWTFGRYSAGTPSPLKVYVRIEVLIGVVAILFPIFASLTLGLPGAARIVASVVMLLIPTFLMGGTLPLVVAWTQKVGLPEGESLGRLYGLNTVGAASGCLLAGLWAIPALGLSRTNALAAAVNIFIAVTVLLFFRDDWRRRGEAGEAPSEAPSDAPRGASAASWPMHTVAFLSGLATLGIEVLWIRLLRITLGSTTYTFTLVIGTFILGLGLGGLWAGRVPEGVRVERRLAKCQLLLVALLTAQFVALPWTPAIFETLRSGSNQWDSALLGSAVVCLLLLLPVTLVIGYIFPLLGRLYMRGGRRGRDVGHLYTVNTVGAVLGAILTTLWLVPFLGTTSALLFNSGLMLISLGIYLRLAGASLPRWGWPAAAVVVLGFLAMAAVRPGWTADYLGYGVGWTNKLEDSRNVYFEEGRSSTVLVESYARGEVLRIDGKPVASTLLEDNANQLLLGHLPAVLTSRVEDGLVVGLGTGMTLAALAMHTTGELHLVELEPRVVEATDYFEKYHHGVMDLPNLQVHYDDGFNYLHATRKTFDVITSDPIQPFFRGAATLYSVEYFARSAERLAEGGVMAHWLPLGQMSDDDFKMIVRSFTDVFPYARLYWTGSTTDAILIGRNEAWDGLGVDAGQFEKAAASVATIALDSADEIASLLVAERPVLRAWAGEGIRNTIEMPILEFTAGRALYAFNSVELLDSLLLMRQRTAGEGAAWRATTVVLAHRAQLAPQRHGAALLDALLASEGCRWTEGDCALAESSALLRRTLWSRALSEADRALQRMVALGQMQELWWFEGEPEIAAGFAEDDLERGVEHYALAEPWTSAAIPGDRAVLDGRLARLLEILPAESPQAERVRGLQAGD